MISSLSLYKSVPCKFHPYTNIRNNYQNSKYIYSIFHTNNKKLIIIFSKLAISTIIDFMATQHKEIDAQTLENLLYLSRLSPESTNMETLKKQVDDIVGYFDILSKYDDSENPYDAYPRTEADKLRGDTVVEGLEISDVKKVSENFMDGYFQVPKVLGEGA